MQTFLQINEMNNAGDVDCEAIVACVCISITYCFIDIEHERYIIIYIYFYLSKFGTYQLFAIIFDNIHTTKS